MTNQEVNEYMHRYLDDDLSEDETELLMEHLRRSPASAAMFERLKRLNSDLEQLPKVTPPISIVDSILPLLEREGLWNDSGVSSTEQTALFANKAETDAPARTISSGRPRINYKWFGGVVAAGIALTLFITTFGPGTPADDSADESLLQRSETSAANSSLEKAPASEEPMANESATEDTADAADKGDAGAAADIMSVDEGAAAEDKPEIVEEPVAASTDERTQPDQPDQQSKPQEAEVRQRHSEPPAGSSTPESTDPDEALSKQSDEAPVADATVPSKDKSDKGELNQSLGFVAEPEPAADPTPVVAPDKASSAVAVDLNGSGQIVISDNQGNNIYKSAVYEGTLLNLQWSEDSTKLTFDVTADAVTRLVTIDLKNQTEIVAQ